jgi:hypothetical protein
VGGEVPVTSVSSLDSSSLNLFYKLCDNRHHSSFDTHSSHLQKFSCAQVWRVVAAATTATCVFIFSLGLSFGYGLDFMLGMLTLESDTLPLLVIGTRVFFHNYSLSRLRCSRVASTYVWVTILLYCLWLNENTYYF